MPVRAWKATHQKPNRFPFAKSPKPARKGGTGSTRCCFTTPPCKALNALRTHVSHFSAQSPREPVERNKTRQHAFYCVLRVISWVLPDWFTRTARGGVLRLSRLVSSLKFVKLERCALICFFAVGSETCAACGAKTRLAGGCAHCVNTTTFPNFF